ncbi:MAG: DUF4433 domain-containing protein [Microbacteriaceae bacterium]|nr:MAG: DUF4433 domain-containing protein [Microbacteriaceae bacterium]
MSVDECIHGMVGTQCAVCYPKPAPAAPPKAPASRPARTTRPTATPRTPVTRRAAGTPAEGSPTARSRAAQAARSRDIGEQRIYHVTHIGNLSLILEAGRLLADASDDWTTRPDVDISSADNRASRRRIPVVAGSELTVAHYVPFFLSPNAFVWESIRSQHADPRLSRAARGASAYDFVILVTTVKQVTGDEADDPDTPTIVATDGDAVAALTRFGAARETSTRMLRTMLSDDESDATLRAELLVHRAVPFDRVSLIGVANDKVRQSVKAMLGAAAHRPKVAVYPPWFQPAE